VAGPLIVYVDVDDTLIRSIGHKRIPIPAVVRHVRELAASGAHLYCWSTGGAEYARATAEELQISACFLAFLPKPQVVIDDQPFSSWRDLQQLSPSECTSRTPEDYT
jgi:predicted HAD superfamily phosphohydrolase YqeG